MAKQETAEKIVQVFSESVCQILETMAFVPAKCGAAQLKTEGKPMGDISSSIGITGDAVCGNLSLLFDRNVGKAIYLSMMMMDADEPVEETELRDAMGELANMVAGGAKSKGQEHGISFVISLPTITVGDNHHVDAQRDTLTYVVPVETAKGTFCMQLSMSF